MVDFKKLLSKALTDNGYSFSVSIQDQFCAYLALLQKWNKVINLTAIDSPKEMVYLHILDSLSATPYMHGTHMIDVGTGAGLPGIPLAIINPNQEWVLLDKSNKKVRFLTQVIAELGLKNVIPVAARCEDFKDTRCFDTIITRAFASIQLMLEKTEHLICPHGRFIAMKGLYPTEELQTLAERFRMQGVHRVEIKGLSVDRHLIWLEKL